MFGPYWMDSGLGSDSRIYYQLYDIYNIQPGTNMITFNSNLNAINNLVRKYKPAQSSFTASWAIVVTWEKVHPKVSADTTHEHLSYQALITTNGINSFCSFGYRDFNVDYVIQRQTSIGFKLDALFEQVPTSFQASASKMHQLMGNQDLVGFYFYEITKPDAQGTTSLLECLNWYKGSLDGSIPDPFKDRVFSSDAECPCTDVTRALDWRCADGTGYTYNRDGMHCVSAKLQEVNPGTRECCYTDTTGTLVDYESRFLTRFPYEPEFDSTDRIPRRQCCQEAGVCEYWRAIRPITPQCRSAAFVTNAELYGDPHFGTLDGKQFTFNGKGEYTMLRVNTSTQNFELQARTGQATQADGTTLDATVFMAFAGKDVTGNTSFHVELSHDRTSMVIYLNGRDFTFDFYNDTQFSSILNQRISAVRIADKLTLGFIELGISITVQVDVRMLSISPSISDTLAGKLAGLLGNFNGNPNDDFIFPNGTVLPNVNMTDREIFDYAKTWAITESTSYFLYDLGQTFSDINDPTFVPFFLSDFTNATALAEANQICGTGSTTCVYDYLVTRDVTVASQTKNIETQAEATRTLIDNIAPVISGNSTIEVEIGKLTSFTVTVSDADQVNPPAYQIINQPVSGFSFDNATGLLRWTPQNTNVTSISLTAVDNFNVGGIPLIVDIILCSGCSGRGTCNYTQTRSTTDVYFKLAACDCQIGYEGLDCAQEVNGCVDNPCTVKRNCTDLTPTEEALYGAPYICSECPAGYSTVGSLCRDINECLNATLNNCDQKSDCVNTEGSFLCTCKTGYRDINNVCVDINECIEDTDGCVQECVNNEGSFTCDCFIGYQLDGDGKSCSRVPATVLDACDLLNCSYTCSNNTDSGNFECTCPGGYELDNTGKDCTDIDECQRNICQQECTNNVGSFECSCVAGYILHIDKTSCEACIYPTWGENCASTCNCGEGASTCDPALGCVCKSGWTGVYCNIDVNECAANPLICGADKTCENINGFYRCNCPTGYENINHTCVNINECVLDTHTCTQNAVCKDNVGSYTCICPSGYAEDGPNKCKNIDECTLGVHACSQICRDVEGSYNCYCEDGFQLESDRKTCVKVSDPCAAFAGLSCSYACRVVGSVPECYCESGYQLANDNQTCQDVNECTTPGLSQCSHECTNTPGSYTCSCSIGYQLENDGRTCTTCNNAHWGLSCVNQCNCGAFGTTRCDNIIGCVCKDGWTGPQCTEDINECLIGDPCPRTNEECSNIQGSYLCKCITGYSNDTGTCEDVNECNGTNVCSQDCTNTVGSYTCECVAGFTGASECADIDECALSLDGCDHDCFNSIGSYRCTCPDGLELDLLNRKKCKAKTICSNSNVCNQTCAVNSNGQEYCLCDQGYALGADNASCINVNECLNTACSQICTDLTPGFQCSCNDGYSLQTDSISCRECDVGLYGTNCSETCACIAENTLTCDKTSGGCTCNTGWTGKNCSDNIDECALGTSNCGALTTCKDLNGSFICDCNHGRAVSHEGICVECPNGRYGYHCDGICTCNFENTASCDKVNGICNCMDGWTGTNCNVNINECNNSAICGANANCRDTNGSYACDCFDGFQKDASGACIDTNECTTGSHNCSQYANCTNEVPYFACTCNTGFTGDGYTCTDIDECATGNNSCLAIANCTNTIGSHECTCEEGLSGDGVSVCTGRIFHLLTSVVFTVSDPVGAANTSSPYYQSLLSNFTQGFADAYNRTIQYFSGIKITSIRDDVVVIKHDLYTEDNDEVVGLLLKAIEDITFEREPLNVGGEAIPVILYGILDSTGTYRNYSKSNFNGCDALDALQPCTGNTDCVYINGLYSCIPPQPIDNFAIIMALSVGVTLFALTTCCCCCWLVFMWRRRRRRRQAETETSPRSDSDEVSSKFSHHSIKPMFAYATAHHDPFYLGRVEEDASGWSTRSPSVHMVDNDDFDPVDEEPPPQDDTLQRPYSNFSWDFIWPFSKTEEFRIPRPTQSSNPNPIFENNDA